MATNAAFCDRPFTLGFLRAISANRENAFLRMRVGDVNRGFHREFVEGEIGAFLFSTHGNLGVRSHHRFFQISSTSFSFESIRGIAEKRSFVDTQS